MPALLDDGPREACGLFGVYGHEDAAKLTYFGLYALQHRGQESAGIVASDGRQVATHKAMGLVPDVFNEDILAALPGHIAIGHVRYSTTGSSLLINAQPFSVSFAGHNLSLAHNGNLTNSFDLRQHLEVNGSLFQTTMDTEIIVHLLARAVHKGLEEAFIHALSQVHGAYSLLLMTEDTLIAARDPYGLRPLCLGRLNGSYVIASETCALDLVEAEFWREIEPGEVVVIDKYGLSSEKPFAARHEASCIFEFIYFARPDSTIFGQNVYQVRKRLGAGLAGEHPRQADFVMPFPDSGNYAALGYAEAAGLPFEMGVIRNHYVGRTFIQPSQTMRDFGVRVKLNPVRELLRGKEVVIVEDSIIRGTTSRTRVQTLRRAGAKKVHMVVSCPPHRFPCFYGIDFSTRGELIAAEKTVDEIRDFVGLDSLGYLSVEGLAEATGCNGHGFCMACFTGEYPEVIKGDMDKHRWEMKCCGA